MRRQPLIIGAGPAGTAAAIRLAQAGHHPILLDRAIGPTDKVCGDFLGADAIIRLRALGVDPSSVGAASIHQLRLVHGNRVIKTALPFLALGLSRRILDQALLNRAIDSGAEPRLGTTVRRISQQAGARDVGPAHRELPRRSSSMPLTAASTGSDGPDAPAHDRTAMTWHVDIGLGRTIDTGHLFLATGKHDLRDFPRPCVRRGAVGLKMYYDLGPAQTNALTGAIELFLFPGGYAGLQCIEAGKSVLCIALRRARLQAIGGTWQALVTDLQSTTPLLRERLAAATPLLQRPLAIAGVPYGFLHRGNPTTDSFFRVGDQAAVIPSLTGDGIAIALHTGTLAAQFWLDGQQPAAYHRRLTEELGGQMRLAVLLHRIAMAGPLQAVGVRAAGWFPGLLRSAATGTRINHPIAASTNVRTGGLHPA